MSGRDISGFAKLVRLHFDKIAQSHKMICAERPEIPCVCYENASSRLCVYFDSPRSREVVVAVGQLPERRGPNGIPFDLREILRSQHCIEAAAINGAIAESAEALSDLLGVLAPLTQQWAARLLDGDQDEFAFLGRFRSREAAEFPILDIVRKKIVAAWWQKDYKAVVLLSRALGPRLTRRELERWHSAEEELEKA